MGLFRPNHAMPAADWFWGPGAEIGNQPGEEEENPLDDQKPLQSITFSTSSCIEKY